MTPQNNNNHTANDLIFHEGDEMAMFELKRMMIRTINGIK
jgi:hypothetical protein